MTNTAQSVTVPVPAAGAVHLVVTLVGAASRVAPVCVMPPGHEDCVTTMPPAAEWSQVPRRGPLVLLAPGKTAATNPRNASAGLAARSWKV